MFLNNCIFGKQRLHLVLLIKAIAKSDRVTHEDRCNGYCMNAGAAKVKFGNRKLEKSVSRDFLAA